MATKDQLYVAYQAAAVKYGRISGSSTDNVERTFNHWYQMYKVATEKPKQIPGAFGNRAKLKA